MIPTHEIGLGKPETAAKRTETLAKYPTASSLAQESGKIVRSGKTPSFINIYQHLGLDEAKDIFDRLQFALPGLDSVSNLAKVRLARAGAIHHLISGELPHRDILDRSVEYILTDPILRDEAKAQAITLERAYSPQAAQEKDLQFIRTFGGSAIERRVLDGKITREQAVAISSIFESSKYSLSALERTQVINFFVNNPDSSSITFKGSLPPDQVKVLIFEIRLRSKALSSIVDLSFTKTTPKDAVPFSEFEGILDKVNEEFNRCRKFESLKEMAKELKSKELIPREVDSLRRVLDIISAHPEIKAVSFDLYNTLVEWSSGQIERRGRMDELSSGILKRKFGLTLDKARFNQAAEKAWRKRAVEFQEKGIEININQTITWMVDDILADSKVTSGKNLSSSRGQIIKDLTQTWYKVELETATAMPGVIDVVRQLKARGLKLTVTSNASWSQEHVTRLLKKFGLEEYFDEVSLSSGLGIMKHKDRVEFYHQSWGKLGVEPSQVLHIGDDREADQEGAINAGGHGVYLNNPNALITTERARTRGEVSDKEYTLKALRHHELAQNREALSYINRMIELKNIPIEKQERLRQMAQEIYQKSRDVIGPANLVLADRLLTKLKEGKADLVLCMARDGIPVAIATKLLSYLEQDRYEGVSPDKVKYAYASRKFVDRARIDPEFKEKFLRYLDSLGVDKADNILISDLFSSGEAKTHLGVVEFLAGKHVNGLYLDVAYRPDIPNREGLIKPITGDPLAGVTAGNMLFLLEGLYNGLFESTKDFKDLSPSIVLPINGRQEPTPDVLDRGLSAESILLLHQVAIRGLIDSVHTLHRRRLLGVADRSEKVVMDIYNKFTSEDPTPIWIDIWRSIPWKDHATGWRRQIDIATDVANHPNPGMRDPEYLRKIAA